MKKALLLLTVTAILIGCILPGGYVAAESISDEVTYSEYRFPQYTGEPVPGYTAVNYYPEKLGSLFVFCSQDGCMLWRVYAVRDEIQDGEIVGTEEGFLPCTVKNAVIRLKGYPCCRVEIAEDAVFVDISAEPFGTATEGKSKDKYIVERTAYGTYDDTESTPAKEVHWSYMYPANETGPMPGAVPVSMGSKGKVNFVMPGGDVTVIFTGKTVANKKMA